MEAIKTERIPWAPIIITTIVVTFFGIGWVFMLPTSVGNWFAPGTIGCFQQFSQSAFILTMAAVFLTYSEPLRRRLSSRSITYAYVTGLSMANMIATGNGFNDNLFTFLVQDRYLGTQSYVYLPWFAAPRAEIAQQLLAGGIPVPWAEWLPSILFFWLVYAVGSAFYISLAAILRRSFIDIEKVPFPTTVIINDIVRRTSRAEGVQSKLGRPFSIGIVLGIVFNVPLVLINLFPWFPDIYGWRANMCGPGSQWLTPNSPIAQVVGFAMFNKNPALVATFYLAPLGILFSAVLWYIIFMVLMQLAYVTGYYSGILDLSGCGRVWCGSVSYRVGDPFKWFAFTSAGVGVGLAIFYLLLNRRYIGETVNAALGRLTKQRLSEIERNEPISYRNAYLMLLTTTILMFILFTVYGIPLIGSIALMAVGLMLAITNTRLYGMVNYIAPAGTGLSYGYLKLAVGDGTMPPSGDWVRTFTWGHSVSQPAYTGWAWPMISSFGGYTMASMRGVDNKSIFKIVTVVTILGLLVVVVSRVWWLYAFGETKMPNSNTNMGSSSFILNFAYPDVAASRPAQPPWQYHVLAGILVAGVLMYLRSRFIWFPLEPLGLILATDGHALIEGIWTMFTVAWILKTITLRVGGSKLYENVGVPTVAGFLAGYLGVAFIAGLIFVVRFFVPF